MKAEANQPEKFESAVRLSYPGGYPVYLSRYAIVSGEERRAALRFFNSSENDITGVRFRLAEKDEDGQEIVARVVEQRGFFAERGTEFTVNDAFLSEACVAVEAQVLAVFSDEYEYVVEEGGVRLRYGPEEEKKAVREIEATFEKEAKYKVRKKKKKYIWITLFAVLGFAVVAAALAWQFGILQEVETADAASGTVVEKICNYAET